jgi:hypothetical protein
VALGYFDDGFQRMLEDQALIFATAKGNAITLADIDAVGPETLTLSVLHGSLVLATLAGLTVNSGANGTASLTVTGTLADLNAALDGLTYLPTGNYNGLDTLNIQLDDHISGTASTAVAIAITVQPEVPDDFNGDLRSDILFQNAGGTPAVWLMNDTGTGIASTGPALSNPGPTWHAKDSADFNRDGKADILWQNDSGTPAVWLMDGTGVLSMGPALPNPGPGWHANKAADFNGDGKADILWQHDDGRPAIWLMDGVNLLATLPALPNPGPAWHEKAAADFNNDGKIDILWQNDNGAAAVWLMDGVNVLSMGPALPNPGPSWHAVDAGDFSGDNKADILWQNDNGTPAVWLMDGTSVITMGPALTNPGSAWHAKHAIDANGNSFGDILWQNDSGTPAVWMMNGVNVAPGGQGGPLLNPGADWHIV